MIMSEEAKLTKLEVVQVLLRTADFTINQFEDDGKIALDEVMEVLGNAYNEILKEMAD
jgi:hypothetical protein